MPEYFDECYLNDLSYAQWKELCNILDINNRWKHLGGECVGLDLLKLEEIARALKRDESPTKVLLFEIQRLHRTVTCLFLWLYKVEEFQAMNVIKSHVNPKYHFLLEITEATTNHITYNTVLCDQGNKKNIQTNVTPPNKRRPFTSIRENAKIFPQKTFETSSLKKLIPESIRFIPIQKLEEATNNWSANCKLGQGGFGVVYKAYLEHTKVAVKVPMEKTKSERTLRELLFWNTIRHDNILPLYAYSELDEKYILVCQYMSRGSLYQYLHGGGQTDFKQTVWTIRYRIGKGAAAGLQFLHSMNLLHGDVKSSNILLDENFEAKICDFGLAREGPVEQRTHVIVSKIFGTEAYLPGELISHKKFSEKVDVYCFGVVLLELATGLKPNYKKSLKKYVCNYKMSHIFDLMDPRGKGEHCSHLYQQFIHIAKSCLNDDPYERPKMVDVYENFLTIDPMTNMMSSSSSPITQVETDTSWRKSYPIPDIKSNFLDDIRFHKNDNQTVSGLSCLYRNFDSKQ